MINDLEFVFLRPWWLLMAPIGLALAHLITHKDRDSWRRVIDAQLFSSLTFVGDRVSQRLIWFTIATGWLIAVLALAGPAWDKEKAALHEGSDALVIVFDLSLSMNSSDLKPSRMERARFKALEIVEEQQEKAVGLVAFAGDAFDISPLSDDLSTVTHLLHSLHISMMPVQGSSASLGLVRAGELLQRSGYEAGQIMLLTDAVDSKAVEIAQQLKQSGYRLSVIAVGTTSGAPINLGNGEFLKDSSGQFIVAPVDFTSLSELALAGGGLFSLVTDKFSADAFDGFQYTDAPNSGESDELQTAQWKDRGPWLLFVLLPLVALMFRSGWLVATVLFVPISTTPVQAFEWVDLWQRSDQQAAKAVEQQDYDSPVISQHSNWNGVALYRQERFAQAAEVFAHSSGKIARFNQGNAFARDGDLPGAVEQYEAALAVDPDFEDAIFNLELIKKLMKEQQMEQQQSDDDAEQSEQQVGQVQESDELERASENAEQAAGDEEKEDEQEDEQVYAQADDKDLEQNSEQERSQLLEQWLRVIPDDPGGLLRRRFLYEYQQRGVDRSASVQW